MALVAVIAACMLPWWLGAWSVRRSAAASWRWRCFWFGCWARATVRLLGVRLDVEGAAPRPPFVLVCNHLGYLDVAVLASQVDAAFVAKTEVAAWPVLGPLCRGMGTLFLDRRRSRGLPMALAVIDAELAAGRGVLLFPEGTSSGGQEVLGFHPSLLVAAQRAGLPVCWAALSYRTPPGEPAAADVVCWWGDMELLPHLWSLLALPRIEARLTFGERPIAAADRKQLAGALREAVAGACVLQNAAGAGPPAVAVARESTASTARGRGWRRAASSSG